MSAVALDPKTREETLEEAIFTEDNAMFPLTFEPNLYNPNQSYFMVLNLIQILSQC